MLLRRLAHPSIRFTNVAFRAFSGVVASFKEVSFGYTYDRNLLENTSFSLRSGSKVTLMGQNGSGKSSILKLLTNDLQVGSGKINLTKGETVSTAKQTMPLEMRERSVRDFFHGQFGKRDDPGFKLEGMIAKVLKSVNLVAPLEREIKSFSGGQQARLLLAAALITKPSVLLLDEPTNNLDKVGIEHLRELIEDTDQTCMVISHDEDFLNSFTDSVLYLDVHSKKVEMYDGDYFFVKSEIDKRIKKENSDNKRREKEAQKKKDQAAKFAGKGGGMRKVAKTMRKVADKLADEVVAVRQEDVSLSNFQFPFRKPEDPGGGLITIDKLTVRGSDGEMVAKNLKNKATIELGRGDKVHIQGANGIGKTTFLEMLTKGKCEGVHLKRGCKIGYYRQDFHNFDFESTVIECLNEAAETGGGNKDEQAIRKCAAKFMLKNKVVYQKVVTLSEGQKALLSLACLVLEQPSVLVMDEPTNHVNFRHLPAVAKAVRDFDGAVIIVSHDKHFVKDVGTERVIDMNSELEGMGEEEGGEDEVA